MYDVHGVRCVHMPPHTNVTYLRYGQMDRQTDGQTITCTLGWATHQRGAVPVYVRT